MRVFLPQYFEKTWTFVGHYYYHYHQCSSPVGHSPPSSLDYAQTTTDDEKFFYLHSPWCWLSQLSVRSPPMSMSSSCQGAYALLFLISPNVYVFVLSRCLCVIISNIPQCLCLRPVKVPMRYYYFYSYRGYAKVNKDISYCRNFNKWIFVCQSNFWFLFSMNPRPIAVTGGDLKKYS